VLIIDDNVVDSDLLARLLAESKYQVLHASRGEEGISAAERDKPDLIMLDLSMPEMDGYEVMRRLKERTTTRDIPVIIYTAKDLTEQETDLLRRDAQRVFLKNPLEPTKMLAEIGDLFKSLGPAGAETPGNVAPPDPSAGDRWERTATAVQVLADAVAAGAPKPPTTSAASGAGRILLVEDDPANQYTIEFMLKTEGYEVTIAENGREAIEKTTELHPDVVLMDMMMPVMGGHEATKALKDTPGVMDIPVIALTAAAMAGDREKALAAGCDDYVSKPVDRVYLLERVNHWIARAQQAQRTNRPLSGTPDHKDVSPK
jgi:CheY-like chemotaxis protein